ISWFEYGLTTLIGVGKIQTLTLKVYQYVNEANIYFAALASCLLFLPPLILIWVNKRFVFRPIEEGRGPA
ncbi:MAG: ABC transporter permease, partial [Bacteroidota bacterium]